MKRTRKTSANIERFAGTTAGHVPEYWLNLDLTNDETVRDLGRPFGGHTVARVVFFERDGKGKMRRGIAFLTARVSGDDRAGCTSGVHFELTVKTRSTERSKKLHASAYLPACERCGHALEANGACAECEAERASKGKGTERAK